MAIRNYVPVDVTDLPETFDYDLDNVTYEFTFEYNSEGDFYTCTIADPTVEDGDGTIISCEKLVLNQPLFANYTDTRLPLTPLVPMDESGQEKRVSVTNFGITVQLYEDTIGDDYSDGDDVELDQDWGDGSD